MELAKSIAPFYLDDIIHQTRTNSHYLGGGRLFIVGNIMTSDLLAFVSYLNLLTWPMVALGWVTNLIQRGAASLFFQAVCTGYRNQCRGWNH